jgi:hypothetical protein
VGSGLIYAIIVVLWAIVLVPMWLRRHDAETESRSVDRFSSAMKILSRRPGGRTRDPGPRSVVMPPIAADSDAPLDLDTPADGAERPAYVKPTRRPVTAPAPQVFVSRPAPRGTNDHLKRRRTILLGLALLLVVAASAFAFGVIGLWAPLLAFALAGGYLALMTSSASAARREAEARRRQSQRERMREGVVEAPNAWHDTVVLNRSAVSAEADLTIDVRRREDESAGTGWQPTSIPVPTYVTAPAASVLPREIDRRYDGAWDAQGMLEEAAAVRADAMRSHELDATPTGEDVWTRATSDSSDRDAVFDREWFESDFEGTSAEQIAQDDASRYLPRRRAVNE